ncbi:hypothetical protein T481_14230 [Enterococcus faecalis PF3]|nr:hypothetical protein T481_14230 [Enterococcus faecalis PF3]
MNKYEVEKRLCEGLGIEYLHLNLRSGPSYRFSEEEYQKFKETLIKLNQIEGEN